MVRRLSPARGPCRAAASIGLALLALLVAPLAGAAPSAFVRMPEAADLGALAERAPAEAWAPLQPLRARFEGDPDFDLLLARAAIARGETAVARLALERVEFFAPRMPGVRALLVSVQLADERGAADGFETPAVDRAALTGVDAALRDGAWDLAFERAAALRDVWEGDAGFDYLFGLSALETGRAEEAVFALQRVLFLTPDQARVRAHLARAHFVGGNLDQAEAEFRRVLEEGPPPAIRESIRGYLREIERQRDALTPRLVATVGASAGWDENVNSATTDATVATPIGTFPLGDGGRAQASGFTSTRVDLLYEHPLSRRRRADLVLAASLRHNFDAPDFDLDAYRLEAGHTLSLRGSELRAAVVGSWTVLGGETFQRTGGVATRWTGFAGDWRYAAELEAAAVRFPEDGLRDVDRLVAELSARWFGGRDLVALAVTGGTERARSDAGDHHGRDLAGLSASWSRLAAPGHLPFVRVSVLETRHHDEHPVFAQRREDARRSAALGWNWLVDDAFSARAEVSWTETDSTLALFDFERVLVETGLRYRF
jgi:tetratricopeptide (TPR) repeat protein